MRHEQKQIGCRVVVDAQQLEEYQIDVEGAAMSCWVAAPLGKTYKVEVTNEAFTGTDRECLIANLFIDGGKEKIDGSRLGFYKPCVLEGRYLTSHELQPLKFSQMETRPSVRGAPARNPSNLSTIRVEVWKAEQIRKSPPRQLSRVETSKLVDETLARNSGRICDRLTT